MIPEDPFERLDAAIAEGHGALFDRLEETLRSEKRHAQLFDALLMRKRHELGLPVQGTDDLRGLPEEVQASIEAFYIGLCREVGGLFLESGDLLGAWPYFRAIDEAGPMSDALDRWAPGPSTSASEIESVIQVALAEGASPGRGFELVLERDGPAKALEAMDEHVRSPGPVQERCAGLLVRRVARDVREKGPEAPPTEERLLRGAVRVAALSRDPEVLELGIELAEHGRALPRSSPGQDPAPFEDYFADTRIYLLALLGRGVDGAVRYFRAKAERTLPGSGGKHVPGEVLVTLLDRVGRPGEAVEAFLRHLGAGREVAPTVPKLIDLCARTGDFAPFLRKARERRDLVEYSLGLVLAPPPAPPAS